MTLSQADDRPTSMTLSQADERPPAFGPLLLYWRRVRKLSQLALAHEADVSPRHVCFIETGRARPSKDMVLQLASTLDAPLRERNALLLAAGFAPLYKETSLDAPELTLVRTALDALLRQQEPFPSVVLNRHWDIVRTNSAAERFFRLFLEPGDRPGIPNLLRLMFDPSGLRPHVANWEAVAETLIQRVHREAVGGVTDVDLSHLIDEVCAYPDVPRRWRTPDLATPLVPVIPVRFAFRNTIFSFFSTVTVLGTPQDVTLQELRIESFFPADPETERMTRDRL